MASDSKLTIEKLQTGPDELFEATLQEILSGIESEESLQVLLPVLPSILSTVQGRGKYPESSIPLLQQFLESVLILLPKHLNSSKYLETFRNIPELDRPLYSNIAQDERVGSWNPLITEDLSWRASLTEGDQVDCVKVDPKFDCKCWAKATIKEITADDQLLIHFDSEVSEYDRILSRTSHELSKYNEKSSNDSWRDSLKVNSLIDCMDNSGQWHNSIVVDTRKVKNSDFEWAEVRVGFRSYEPYGEKSDDKGSYRGWSCNFDEWVPIKSPRITSLGLNGRRWNIPRENFNEEDIIDDCNDMLETNPDTYCVTRYKKSNSIILLNAVNRFGKLGMFEFMVNTLQDSNNWPSFEVIYSFVTFTGRLYALFHKKFAMNYVIKFKNAVFHSLIAAPVSNYRDYSKEKLDQIFEHLENLLKRVFTIQLKNKAIDEFLLEFSLKNLETPYLEKRIYGIRWISEAANKSNLGKLRGMKIADLAKWIKNKSVLNHIFGDESHDQIVQRTGEVLKLLASDDSLTLNDINLIWAVSQKNEDLRKVVYSVLVEVNSSMKPDILAHIVQKVAELHPSKVLQEEVNLVYELTKLTTKAGLANNKACEFFHYVVLVSEDHSDYSKNLCLEAYCNLLKSWEKSKNRPAVIESCVENIRENRNVLYAIKTILKIIITFPIAYCTKDMPTRNTIAQKMINDQGVIQALFDNIQYLKQTKDKVSNYSDEICERLNFLKVLISECFTIKITERQLTTLWNLLYETSSDNESKAFIKWLKETTDSQVNNKKIFEDNDINKFFIEKIGNVESNFAQESIDEFLVFKNCFLCINLSTHKITRLFSNLSQSSSEHAPEFDYSIGVPPIELHGMLKLRKILIQASSQNIQNLSSALLYNIYNQVTTADVKKIRMELLKFLLNILKNGSNPFKKRALEILKKYSEECEKNGTSRLSPHCALLKGEICHISIINSIAYVGSITDVPKKFELSLHSNTTVWQLRNIIGKKVKCLYDQFKIYRSVGSTEIYDRENGKTLYNLKLRPSESLTLYNRVIPRQRVPLLTSDQRLVPAAEKIFRKWFYRFADKADKMSADGAADFTNNCTGENCKGSDRKMQDFVANHDDDKDGLLTVDNFLEFYRISCLAKPHAVWNNLNHFNYRNDLLGYDDDVEATVDFESLPSTLLSENREDFDLIFEHLDVSEVACQAWDLVCKLPTSPAVLKMVSDITENSEWDKIFCGDFSYKLLYVIQVIQSFLQDPSPEESEKAFEEKRKWKICFIKSGGVRVLLNKLEGLAGNLSSFQKVCLDSLVKIVSIFILAAFSVPDIYETIQMVRKESENFELFEEETGEKKVNDEGNKENTKNLAFTTLSEDIRNSSLSSFLLDSIDFQALISNLLTLMFNIINNGELESDDKSIIDSALELWISCTLHKNELLSCLYSFSSTFEAFLTQSLTKPKIIGVRKSFAQAYLSICKKVLYNEASPVPYFLQTILTAVESKEEFFDCSQLYELLCNLIEIDKLKPTQEYLKLSKFFIKQIFEIPYKECKSKSHSDSVLVGVLKVANKIFESFLEYRSDIVTESFIDQFFSEILFPAKAESHEIEYTKENLEIENQFKPPKAKTRESRKAAYNLLLTLTVCHEPWSKKVIDTLQSLKTRVKPLDTWNYSPTSQLRSLHGYAGIFNYSAICYMSSVLQQFFMIPQFRYSILAANDNLPPDMWQVPTWFMSKNNAPNLLDNNLLHQLQKLYGYLELTDRQAYRPAGFCFAYKDFSGEPVNTSIHQDAQEFINLFLDRLEKCLSLTEYKNLLANTFKGKISNQIICNECRHVSETYEDFYNISLDVKHSKSLHESFTKYITGDTISGYMCNGCNKQVDIRKRSLLHNLPNYLIVHFQRMVFNFDTMENEKINSRVEFPMNFNVFPYSVEGVEGGLSTDEYSYELKGIIVHTGTAQSGHYISYIKDPVHPKKWYEFNDSTITSFNPESIEANCFGGVNEGDNFIKSSKLNSTQNAYMLIYEKIIGKKPVEIIKGDNIIKRDFESIEKSVPNDVFREILKDNDDFLFEKNLFSFEFFEFLLSSLRNARYLFDVSQITLGYSLDVVAHSYNNKSFSSLADLISECFNMYPESETYFFNTMLNESGEKIINYLFRCGETQIRQSVADLLFIALKNAALKDFSETGLAKQTINILLGFIPQEISKYSSKFEQYWYLFSKLTTIEHFNLYLLEKGTLAAFVDFYLGNDSPLAKGGDNQLGKSYWNSNFKHLVLTVYNFHLFINKSTYEFSENDYKCITHPEFYIKTLRKNYDENAVRYLVQFWATANFEISEKLAEVLLAGINEIEVEEQEPYYETIKAFLNIEDEFSALRAQWIFGVPVPIHSNRIFSIQFCAAAITAIDEDVHNYPSFLNTSSLDTKQSVTSLAWSQRKRWDGVCLLSLKWILDICLENKKIFSYLHSLPPPTYQYFNYYHWMHSHIKSHKPFNANKRDQIHHQALELLSNLDPVSETVSYIISDTISFSEKVKFESEFITVKEFKYKCLFTQSLPNGKTNDAIPHLRLYIDKDKEIDASKQSKVFKEGECVVVYAVMNNSKDIRQVYFEFVGEIKDVDAPIHSFTVKVQPESEKSIISLEKKDPDSNWEDFQILVKEEKTTAGNRKVQVDSYTDSLDFFGIDEMPISCEFEEFITAPSGQISCPACTFYNDVSNLKCTICSTALPRR